MLFMVVTLDVSKLSGWLNAKAYCRVERRAWRMRCGARYSPGGVRAMWVAETQSACTGRARLKVVGTRGAHPEHEAHVRDLGRVEAERLVEHIRDLPSRKAGMRRVKRCTAWGGVRGGGDANGMHGEGPTQGWGTRGAHVEHVVHISDLGRVEAERLVERLRDLPSRKAGMRCGKRYGPRV